MVRSPDARRNLATNSTRSAFTGLIHNRGFIAIATMILVRQILIPVLR
ncbi:hypothetical protein [Pleurocapsa sp. FMAR1]|nr:hypothetical protein [Pleurocapsa sp. FMAR1]